jgi:poly(3-hydroxybutyrate) depolymerase
MIPTTLTTQGAQQPIIIRVPAAYDPATAYPLVFGFHGAGLKASDCQGGNCAGVVRVMGEKALLVFMQSFGGNWEGAANREKNVTQFSDALKYMRDNFCVDEGRIAAVGSSSGATFSNILGCRFGDILRTVSPVAGSVPEKTNCKGTPPTIVIQGVSDNFAGGQGARDWYAMRNGCGPDTTPPMAAEIAKVQAARAASPRMEIHACSSYTTCTAAPVRFCAHSVGGYDGSTHGWPPIGGQLIWDFLMEQK